ncbi:MAG: pilus assembly protein N-terminal domain-containing protein [Bryobacterales bacterium]|nr:pilus assembly protein N-terminal domain-containing protein [Bryobacterales bacterium]
MFSIQHSLPRTAAICALHCLALLGLDAVSPVALAQSTAEEIRITLGKSIVIDYPVDVARISTSNPDVVDAVAVSTREVLLHAKSHGICTIVVWSKTGQRTFYNISVEHNLEPIRRILKETFPNDPIQIQAARDSITLTGRVASQAVADRAAALAASLSKTVINNLQVNDAGVEKQVLLRVKFAELDRTIARSFGVNLVSTGALGMVGSASTNQFAPPRPNSLNGTSPGGGSTPGAFSLTDALNVFAFRPELNLAATIRALQAEGVLQIIAEPNLVTTNAKEASFLVGGEFPVPVLQGGANSGAVTVQFREYGIRLSFNPQLTSHNTMKMYVKPEVSTIDLANSVTVAGFTIPALATRRMETNIELGPGQSFVIGGLIDDRVQDQMNKIPGLGNIPVLGSLFKSRSENKSRTELLVMVTPEIVDPLNPADPKPVPVMPREFMAPLQIKPTSQKGTVDPVKSKARKLRAKQSGTPATEPVLVQPVAVPPPAAEAPKTGGVSH